MVLQSDQDADLEGSLKHALAAKVKRTHGMANVARRVTDAWHMLATLKMSQFRLHPPRLDEHDSGGMSLNKCALSLKLREKWLREA